MNKVLQLKIAAMMLFWFGVMAELMAVFVAATDYVIRGYSDFVPIFPLQDIHGNLNVFLSIYNNLNLFGYLMFAHFIHIVAAYWLSKGRKKGWVVAIAVSIYEIVTALLPTVNFEVFTPYGFAVRILFAVIIFLSISGRKKLIALRYENWRPWKNPKTTQTNYPILVQHERAVAPVSKVRIATGILLMFTGTLLIIAMSNLWPARIQEHTREFLILGITIIIIGIYLLERWERASSLFVCGECNRTFLNKSDLRNHDDIEHAKKD